jgi:hypothetical protein
MNWLVYLITLYVHMYTRFVCVNQQGIIVCTITRRRLVEQENNPKHRIKFYLLNFIQVCLNGIRRFLVYVGSGTW